MDRENTTWKAKKPLQRPMNKMELKRAGYGQSSPKVFTPKKKK
jgi:hypothetical protein